MEEKDIDRHDPPIVKETVLLLEYYAPVYRQIPNWAKHGVATPALNRSLQDLLFFLVSAAKQDDKRPLLEKADACLDCVRIYVRILNKNRLITVKQYEQISKHTKSIGKQLGGWLLSL